MSRFTALTVILATITLGSHGHPAMSIRESHWIEEDPIESKCKSYQYAQTGWNECTVPNRDAGMDTPTDYILGVVENTCKNKSAITTCMEQRLGECSTWSTIQSMMGVSFQFCKGNDIPSDLKTFLTINAGMKLTSDCMQFISKEFQKYCDLSTAPEYTNDNMADERNSMERYFDWHVTCFETIPGPADILDKCEGMSRKTIYGILIASLSTEVGFGIDFYRSFGDFMAPGVHAPPKLEQLLEQRSMFNAN